MANNFFNDFNFQNIAKEVQKCVDVVAEKTEEAFNGSKNYVEKVQSTSKLTELYEKLGKAHYITATGQEDQREQIANLMEEISDTLDAIENANKVINKTTELRCPNCRTKNPNSSKFCSRCGTKLIIDVNKNDD